MNFILDTTNSIHSSNNAIKSLSLALFISRRIKASLDGQRTDRSHSAESNLVDRNLRSPSETSIERQTTSTKHANSKWTEPASVYTTHSRMLDSNVERVPTTIERRSDLSLSLDPSTGRTTEKTDSRIVSAVLLVSPGAFLVHSVMDMIFAFDCRTNDECNRD